MLNNVNDQVSLINSVVNFLRKKCKKNGEHPYFDELEKFLLNSPKLKRDRGYCTNAEKLSGIVVGKFLYRYFS